MFPFIDKSKKPPIPQLYLCEPNKRTISKLKHAYAINLQPRYGDIFELTFTLPKTIWKKDKLVRYKQFDMIKPDYLIKLKYIWGVQYFRIDNPKIENYSITVHCWSLAQQLATKKIKSYTSKNDKGEESPIDVKQALTDALSVSYSWKVGHIDESLLNIYRSFSIDNQSSLEFIKSIASEFNATPDFDTDKKLVNMYDNNNKQDNKGLRISARKYLKTFSKDINQTDVVTRLRCFGQNDLSIHAVSPIGQDYVEDLLYYLNGFKRDDNRNVISHSNIGMSDDLAHAILDYYNLIEANKDKFSGYLTDQIKYQTQLSDLNIDLTGLNTQLKTIQSLIAVQQSDNYYSYFNDEYDGNGWSYNTETSQYVQYAVMGYYNDKQVKVKPGWVSENMYTEGRLANYLINPKLKQGWLSGQQFSSDKSTINCYVNSNKKSLQKGKWQVLGKISQNEYIDISIPSHQDSAELTFIVVMITPDEFKTMNNEQSIIEKYNIENAERKIVIKQNQIDEVQSLLDEVQDSIINLKSLLSVENNFTEKQLEEWDNYIHTEIFSDDNYTNAQDLIKAGSNELKKRQQPTVTFDIDIVNFLAVVECQKDWNRLFLGDIITVDYDKYIVKAQLIGIDLDFDNSSIKLTISNAKEILNSKQRVHNRWKKAEKAAKLIQNKQSSINQIDKIKQSFTNFMSGNINASSQPIVTNNGNTFDDYGAVFPSSTDPNSFLIISEATIARTSDGGKTWNILAGKNGISANQMNGSFSINQNIKVIGENYTLDSTGISTTRDAIKIDGGLPIDQLDSDVANNIQNGTYAKEQIDGLHVGGVNLVKKSNVIGSITEL